jgi:hypothetical protein
MSLIHLLLLVLQVYLPLVTLSVILSAADMLIVPWSFSVVFLLISSWFLVGNVTTYYEKE